LTDRLTIEEQEPRSQRLARNQAMFRDVNERVRDLNESFEDIVETHVYACECAEVTCVQQIELTAAEYLAVRSNPRRFFVAPTEEHVYPEIETVVDRAARYWVVEKLGVSGQIAAARAAVQSVS
jgi:hypothetical protein